VIKTPKPARRVVPSLATRWSHARGRKPRRVVPCSWQATIGLAATRRSSNAIAPGDHPVPVSRPCSVTRGASIWLMQTMRGGCCGDDHADSRHSPDYLRGRGTAPKHIADCNKHYSEDGPGGAQPSHARDQVDTATISRWVSPGRPCLHAARGPRGEHQPPNSSGWPGTPASRTSAAVVKTGQVQQILKWV
jgi:hypothetical protein